jgi:hypothetical protein
MIDSVRFNEDKRDYRPAKYVQIKYEDGTIFSVIQRGSGDVDVDLGPKEIDEKIDRKVWKIEPRDTEYLIKVAIDNRFWIIEKWNRPDKVLYKYAKTVKNAQGVNIDYNT